MAGNPVKPLLSLYVTEWRERGYRLRSRMWESIQANKAVEVLVRVLVDNEDANSGYTIVVKAVKVHEEVLRMAITADTVK